VHPGRGGRQGIGRCSREQAWKAGAARLAGRVAPRGMSRDVLLHAPCSATHRWASDTLGVHYSDPLLGPHTHIHTHTNTHTHARARARKNTHPAARVSTPRRAPAAPATPRGAGWRPAAR
jgi:hypothetical protein